MSEPTAKDETAAQDAGGRSANILRTLIDVSRIITKARGLDETLAHTVEVVADSLRVDVCSIYIYEQDSGLLELKATRGLSREAVGKVRMATDEGLIGLVIEQQAPVNLRDVTHHPRFKYFQGIDEEKLASFLGVPLIEYRRILGVLAIQNQEDRFFTSEEENLLIMIASQISGLVSKALLINRLERATEDIPPPDPEAPLTGQMKLEGVPIAPGLARGPVILLRKHRAESPNYAPKGSTEQELHALDAAVEEAERQILALMEQMKERVGEDEASIFHSHLLFLEDRAFIGRIRGEVQGGASAPWAVAHVVRDYLRAFKNLNDPYLRERGADLEDVGERLLTLLRGSPRGLDLEGRSGILAAELLTPSDTAQLDPTLVKGIITSAGGHVSHAAILARSLRIPAVSGIPGITELVRDGEEVLLDGNAGTVFRAPDDGLVAEFERFEASRRDYLVHLEALRDQPCETCDGLQIKLRANVGLPQDLEDYARWGADGIGLYRTEVQYLMWKERPTQQELGAAYTKAIGAANGESVVFRTLDLGGDKFPSYLTFPKEDNPFLGERSIRYQLKYPHLLKDQLKAILRASRTGPARIMFPMISQLGELMQVKRIYNECRDEVAAEDGEPPPVLELGMMFEVPSAVLMCERFAEEIDFLSIGSNDLTQYVMAVDRNNPHVSHLYDPLEPAVLLLIKRLIDAAQEMGKPIELCGELAGDPEGCLVLVGLGLRELSMNAPMIPIVKDRLSQYTVEEMRNLAEIAMNSTTAESVRRNIQLLLK